MGKSSFERYSNALLEQPMKSEQQPERYCSMSSTPSRASEGKILHSLIWRIRSRLHAASRSKGYARATTTREPLSVDPTRCLARLRKGRRRILATRR